MGIEINYEPLNEKYIDEAVELVLTSYNEERLTIPYLPDVEDFMGYFNNAISNLFRKGTGIIATSDSQLIGFLAGFSINEFFGQCKGIYIPLFGHGVAIKYRNSLYKDLYRHAADLWVKNSYMTHAITLHAHDEQSSNTWFWMGFGLRCVDAIREAKVMDIDYNRSISIKKVDTSYIPQLADIHREHNEYYRSSPIFMPNKDEDPIQDLMEWMETENHHLWVAYDHEKPLGYMRIQPDAETFVSEHKSVMNITGAYVVQEGRKSGTGAMLLGEIQQWLKQNGYSLCGVDFESINTIGSSFWNKYFTPYTYSVVRRIDERIENLK